MLYQANAKNPTSKDYMDAKQRAEQHASMTGTYPGELPRRLRRSAILGLVQLGCPTRHLGKTAWSGNQTGGCYWRLLRVIRFDQPVRDVTSHQGMPVRLRKKEDYERMVTSINKRLKEHAWVEVAQEEEHRRQQRQKEEHRSS